MPFIKTDPALPGIRALLAFSPSTATPMGELANTLLRSNDGLSMAERELIAAHVSYLNDCFYCHQSHGAIAACYLNGNTQLVEEVKHDYQSAPISEKLKALITIAASVQRGGKHVNREQVSDARAKGASDKDIHDTVLIAAMFCMFNRYVDGLSATTPDDLSTYDRRAQQIVQNGYGNHVFLSKQPPKVNGG
ncbi:MAG TPA: peroxidase-related enzyme [Flavitalea sp.]|nr:peroxidase-related enzyme [Flavitalea sp.]